jgi:hypothetical protein
MSPPVRWFLALILIAIINADCASGKNGGTEKVKSGEAPLEATSSVASEIPTSLLPTLLVGVDSCYVFLQPDENSRFFGPLVKGENVKRLDAYKYWIYVWIPRLRVAGWVRNYKINASDDEEKSDQGTVSTELLTNVTIAKKRVNIRKAATVRAPIIYKAKQRQEFVLLDEKGGWYQVWIPHLEKKGWVSEKVAVKQVNR